MQIMGCLPWYYLRRLLQLTYLPLVVMRPRIGGSLSTLTPTPPLHDT
jgi:hypothetical protein